MTHLYPQIDNEINPYRDNVQGKANEPITVAGLLDRSKLTLGTTYEGGSLIGRLKKFICGSRGMPRVLQLSVVRPIIRPI